MRRRKAREPIEFDWLRWGRLVLYGVMIFSLLTFLANVTGIAGQMTLAILDGAMGSRLAPKSPALTWAVVGGIAGITPALWSLPTFRKRRVLVLLLPASAMLVFCVLGILAPSARATTQRLPAPETPAPTPEPAPAGNRATGATGVVQEAN